MENYKWVSVDDELPETGRDVLAFYINGHAKDRCVRAFYARQFEIESDSEDDCHHEYCEERDEYYLKEGWYETCDNGWEFSSWIIHEGTVTYWMPMPKAPGRATGKLATIKKYINKKQEGKDVQTNNTRDKKGLSHSTEKKKGSVAG